LYPKKVKENKWEKKEEEEEDNRRRRSKKCALI